MGWQLLGEGRNVDSPACLPRESPQTQSVIDVEEKALGIKGNGELQGAKDGAPKCQIKIVGKGDREACCKVKGRRNQ